MQYIEIFKIVKNENDFFFLIFAQNIDCGNMLESPRRGGSKGTNNISVKAKKKSKKKKKKKKKKEQEK